MLKALKEYKNIASLAIPSLIAICIVEIVNIQVYLSGPVADGGTSMLFLWITLQMIPGFLFGYISDQQFRKASLIICQLLGLVGGLILYIFGFEFWVIVLIALSFNPIPVARAALLDHFPQHSTVKLVAITFLAQYFPWIFYAKIAALGYKTVIFWVLGILAANIILTVFLFKKDSEKKEVLDIRHKMQLFRKNSPLICTIFAFTLAEAAFYLLWAYLEYNPQGQTWFSTSNLATVIGISIAMLYTRLPHISIITLFYSIGAAATLMALVHSFSSPSLSEANLLTSMTFYCIIGGLYLPFVTDGVIKMLGNRRRAIGSAIIELGDTVAVFFAPLLNLLFQQSPLNISLAIFAFFAIATILQKSAERSNFAH